MKRKVIMLFMIIFLVTGCSVDYNLEIDGLKLEENININTEVNSLYTKEDLYNSYLEEYPIYSDDYEKFMYEDPYTKNSDYTYFKKNYQEFDNGYLFKYNANFEWKDYKKARSLNMIFNTIGVGYIKDKDNYYLSLKDHKLDYLGIDKLTVKINFKNTLVVSNNASSINGNTYTWIINRNSDTSINITYQLKKDDANSNPSKDPFDNKTKIDTEKEDSIFDYILVGAVFLLFLIGLVGLIKYKSINKEG